MYRTRCVDPDCELEPYLDHTVPQHVPTCPRCGGPLRPAVVLFGEHLDLRAEHRAKRAVDDCDLLLVAASSGAVATVTSLLRRARDVRARRVLVNREIPEGAPDVFDTIIQGDVVEVLDELVGANAAEN